MRIIEDYFSMRDNIRLYTRIVLPEENKEFPIVFIRTPYEKAHNGIPCNSKEYENDLFVKNGYAVVLQHTRGRGDSEGECHPYQERNDGLDTLEILRKLPFYNGEIFIFGESYLSTVHLSYLDTNPKDVKAAALGIQTDRMYFRNYRNGCCYDYCNIGWWLDMLKKRYPEQSDFESAMVRPYYKIMERIVGEDVPEYTQMLLNDEYNDFWKKDFRTYAVDNLIIPVFLLEGWYDFYIDGMFDMWDRLPQKTKEKSIFVVGPWGHATSVQHSEYPLKNGNISKDCVVKFFNSIRENVPCTEFELGKVNYYSICGDFWTTEESYGGKMCKLYLNSHNTLSDKARYKGERCYEYDPCKKLNYYRFHNIFKAPEENSSDCVLSFVSEPFEKEFDVYGKIKLNMKVKSNCEDTAFFVRVYFVEKGIAYNLTETISSISHTNRNYVPGEECLIHISTPPIGFTMKKGNSIRVDISSHSDIYVPHSNTKGHWAKVTETKVAKNLVVCDEETYIVLPTK